MPATRQPPVTPPEVDRSTAARLLTTQFEAGQRLLRAGTLSEDLHSRWGLNTKSHLERAFGRGSPNVCVVIDAGGRTVLPIGADQRWWAAYRAERLSCQLTELAGVLKLLGAEPKVPVAKPPNAPKPPAARQKAAAPKASSKPEPTTPEPSFSDAAPKASIRPEPTAPEPRFGAPKPEPPAKPQPTPASFEAKVAAPIIVSEPTPEPPASASDWFTGVACMNGHVLTAAAEVFPARANPRCTACGAATVTICRDCGVGLRGLSRATHIDDEVEPPWVVPNFCQSCGGAFPWTTLKQEAIEATIAELDELEAVEQDGLRALVQDTILETPRTSLAVMRWQRALSKLSSLTRELVTDVLKQAANPLVVQHLGLTV